MNTVANIKEHNILLNDQEVELIETLINHIKKYSLKETIDCLTSAIEVYADEIEEKNPESTLTEEYKDLGFIAESLGYVSDATDKLSVISNEYLTHAIRRIHVKNDLVSDIATIKVTW